MAPSILRVVDLKVNDSRARPLSFDVERGEIHTLLFPPGVERGPVLQAIAGLERPQAGRVEMPSGPVHVTMVGRGETPSDRPETPDVVVIDDVEPPANDRAIHDSWARLAAERAHGATIILATALEEQAYRGDRVSLAMWDEVELRDAYVRLGRHMSSLVGEFLRLFEEGKRSSYASIALDLQRLNHAARDLVSEGRSYRDSWRVLSAVSRELASKQLDDRVLQAVIRSADED